MAGSSLATNNSSHVELSTALHHAFYSHHPRLARGLVSGERHFAFFLRSFPLKMLKVIIQFQILQCDKLPSLLYHVKMN